MAIAFDATAEGNTNSGDSVTYSHTCTGSDLILFVGAMTSSSRDITSVTYNGTNMTLINTSAGGQPSEMWMLVNPSTGANDIVLTLDSTSFLYSASGSYTGAAQSGQPDGNNTSSTAAATVTTSVTTTADNSWGVLCARQQSTGDTDAGTGTTERNANAGFLQFYDSGSPKTPPGSLSLQTTQSASGNTTHAMVTFAPAVAGGAAAVPVPQLLTLGIG